VGPLEMFPMVPRTTHLHQVDTVTVECQLPNRYAYATFSKSAPLCEDGIGAHSLTRVGERTSCEQNQQTG
jgi:hypothetical protein